MADYKDFLTGAVGSLVGKAKELAESEGVRSAMDKLSGSSVASIYAQGADRAKVYARITKLTLELNGENTELGRVYAEIGRLCYEQNRANPEGCFAPLFAQADTLTEGIHAREDEIAALKAQISDGKTARDDGEPDFESVVDATEQDGQGRTE